MPEPPRVGSEIAGYRLESLVERGGMAVVYVADHIRLSRKVAFKVLAPELSEDDRFRERFLRESRLAASINHPNIIPIYDAGEADGLLYIAMLYVTGMDLKALIKNEGPLEAERTLSIVGQSGSALDAAHAQGLVHRDVKPANILIVPRSSREAHDHVYLTDFGLTKHTSSRSGLTGTGQFVGTIDYVAPEQIEGKHVDGRADVYSLGCVFYECLTSTMPFKKEDEVAVLWAHIREDPPSISAHRTDLPGETDRVIAKVLAKSPDERFQSCFDFATAARAALGEAGSIPHVPGLSDGTVAAATAPATPGAEQVTSGGPTVGRGLERSPAGQSAARTQARGQKSPVRDEGDPQRDVGSPPSERTSTRRSSRLPLALAAVIGLIVGVAAGWGGSQLLTSPAETAPSGEIYRVILLSHLPTTPGFRAGCKQVTPETPDPSGQLMSDDVFAQASCNVQDSEAGNIHVDYYLIHDTAWMQVTLFEIADERSAGVTPAAADVLGRVQRSVAQAAELPDLPTATAQCATGTRVTNRWRTIQNNFGHLEMGLSEAGTADTSVLPAGGLVVCWKGGIAWTDNQTTILAVARSQLPGNLYTWWATKAGPDTEAISGMPEA